MVLHFHRGLDVIRLTDIASCKIGSIPTRRDPSEIKFTVSSYWRMTDAFDPY